MTYRFSLLPWGLLAIGAFAVGCSHKAAEALEERPAAAKIHVETTLATEQGAAAGRCVASL